MDTAGSGAAPERVAGRYRVEAEIATGGMGAVYRVVDEPTGNRLALKRLLPNAGKTAALLFEREYHTLAGIKHPRIIEVYEYGHDKQGPYYTMELLDGEDLRQLTPMPFDVACRYLRDVASSLALLHARRLLHRDLSARNVRATSDGRCKLIDFGALASFGVTGEVIGTPPGIAPEAVTSMPLDQRADLYGLGALAYYLLTRRHAYPARNLSELAEAWKRQPPAPSTLAANRIPRELDELVLSLLSQDPLARPASAAEVIDRLTVIAGLPPDNEIGGVVDAYLSSGAMLGREKQLTRLKRLVVRTMRGRGGSITISHQPGLGGSRLLTELAVEARLLGATVLQIDAESHRGPNQVARALIDRLSDAAPTQALPAAHKDLDILAWFHPPLAARAGVQAPKMDGAHNPGALRVRLQTALQSWFQAVSRHNVLVVAIDNAQRMDESSAAFVATLAQTSRDFPLLVVTAVRQGEQPAAPAVLRALREAGTSMELLPLTLEQTSAWLGSMFGDVPNVARVSAWLHQRCHGNPGHTLGLARHLVELEVIRYVEGTWILPTEMQDENLPLALDDLILKRIAALSPRPLALLAALGLHRGGLSLQVCVTLCGGVANDAFQAVDELLRFGLIGGTSSSYMVAQERVREHVLSRTEEADRRALHLQIARALQAEGSDIGTRLDAGWHYFHAGADDLGVALLSQAGLSLAFEMDELPAAVPALEAALASSKRLGRPRREMIPLLVPLALAGYYVDRRLAQRYGDEALQLMKEETGLARAERLSVLGPYLSVWLGIGVSLVRYLCSSKLGFYRGFHEQMVNMMTVATALTGVATVCLDTVTASKYATMLAPLRSLGTRHPIGLSGHYCQALVEVTQDHPGRAIARLKQLFNLLRDPAIVKGVPEQSRELLYGGALFAMGALESFRDGDGALRCAEKVDQLGRRLYDLFSAQIRACYHASRGEIEQAEQYRRRVETYAIQHGSAWQAEVWAPASMILSYAITRDVIGMKRTVEQLEQLRTRIPSLERFYNLARGEYAHLRGDHAQTVEILGPLVHGTRPGEFVGRAAAAASLAASYRALGTPERGKALCVETLAAANEADRSVVANFLRTEVELILADAMLSRDVGAAARAIDELIRRHADAEGPVTLGSLHRERAVLAIEMGDAESLRIHLDEMNRWFRPTRNPALIAQCERIAKLAAKVDSVAPAPTAETTGGRSAVERTGSSLLGDCVGPQERAQRALELMLGQSHGSAGFLFVVTARGLSVAAPLHGDAPPRGLEDRVHEEAAAYIEDDPSTVLSEVEPPKRGAAGLGYSISLLTADVRGARAVVGAIAVDASSAPLSVLPHDTLEALGQALYEAGDVVEYPS